MLCTESKINLKQFEPLGKAEMQSEDAQVSSDNELCEHHHVRQHPRQPLWETPVSRDL